MADERDPAQEMEERAEQLEHQAEQLDEHIEDAKTKAQHPDIPGATYDPDRGDDEGPDESPTLSAN